MIVRINVTYYKIHVNATSESICIHGGHVKNCEEKQTVSLQFSEFIFSSNFLPLPVKAMCRRWTTKMLLVPIDTMDYVQYTPYSISSLILFHFLNSFAQYLFFLSCIDMRFDSMKLCDMHPILRSIFSIFLKLFDFIFAWRGRIHTPLQLAAIAACCRFLILKQSASS